MPTLSMSAMDNDNKVMKALTAASVPVLTSLPAFATEGTNEILGIDDQQLLLVLCLVHWSVAALWFNWQSQNEDDGDFFGEIDNRRQS
eukprot:CAMPEP_0113942548 /NCGR_PEP_ID=MMETSP1339-20121228/8221_1 /TAXON_ID=94617 /ORGANISM="Fibrocapsa japonica" /LENGTH=87 /DNA_ID=CAMNT_0000947067 /DNA_START=215 /DNA_END=478 /DNA_ORIENTATION=- /assembly_acc=CAM_ASM_000762